MSRVYRHIKDGFQGVTRHFAMSLSSISSVTVTLLIMSFFLLLSVNIDNITRLLEDSVQIHVLIKPEFSEEEMIASLGTDIRAIPNVKEAVFSSKDEEYEAWMETIDSEDAEDIYGEYRGENNPFLNAYIVKTSSGDAIKEIANTIRGYESVDKVAYGGDATGNFLKTLESVRNIGFGIVVALAIIAIFLISNTIRVSIHSRRKEISIMRTVGATNWYIRWPFIIEGMIIGLIGSIIPIILTIFGYRLLFNSNQGYLISKMFSLVPTFPLVIEISLILALIGMGVGAIGSLMSVGKQLRWTR